jgi:hypothetical protein
VVLPMFSRMRWAVWVEETRHGSTSMRTLRGSPSSDFDEVPLQAAEDEIPVILAEVRWWLASGAPVATPRAHALRSRGMNIVMIEALIIWWLGRCRGSDGSPWLVQFARLSIFAFSLTPIGRDVVLSTPGSKRAPSATSTSWPRLLVPGAHSICTSRRGGDPRRGFLMVSGLAHVEKWGDEGKACKGPAYKPLL